MLLLELLHLQELLLEGQLLVPQRLPRQKEGQIQALFPAWKGRRGLEAAARGDGSQGWQRWGHRGGRCLHPPAGPAQLPAQPDGGFDLSEEEGKEREKGKGKIKRWKEKGEGSWRGLLGAELGGTRKARLGGGPRGRLSCGVGVKKGGSQQATGTEPSCKAENDP